MHGCIHDITMISAILLNLISVVQDEIELQKSIECAKPLLEGKCSRTEDMTSKTHNTLAIAL